VSDSWCLPQMIVPKFQKYRNPRGNQSEFNAIENRLSTLKGNSVQVAKRKAPPANPLALPVTNQTQSVKPSILLNQLQLKFEISR